MRKNEISYSFTALYGLIVIIANICGILISNIFSTPDIVLSDVNEWENFLYDTRLITDPLQYLSFVIPTVWCALYIRTGDAETKIRRIINLPMAYSLIGISGWVWYFIEEIFLLGIAYFLGYSFNAGIILITSFLNIVFDIIITFTLAYFMTESIHRKFILPKLFPDGNISKIKNLKQPGIRFLFVVNYFSVTVFPIVYLFMVIYSNIKNISFDYSLFIVLILILIIGLIITISFTHYFETPIKKLKTRIRQIGEGDYISHVKLACNDSFGEMADVMNDMTDSIEAKTKKILEIQNSVITGMAIMVESRDNSTGGHIKRTSDCVKVFIDHLKTKEEYSSLSDNFCKSVIKAAPMHDLGKIAVDDSILRKPGKFTDEEYEKMKSHSAEGAKIVKNVLSAVDDLEFQKIAINVAHYHHEKWNGQGYPEKISGEQIPIEARIMALADVFDALVSKRCYKDSFTYDKAFEIIKDSLGSHFDPKLGAEFLQCRPQLESLYNAYL